ncbi:hypothetical protein PIB30_097828 [Stylosanthes scabra]|uniref:Uncharacterized protein n=1 Tax=Stylosanthes scabra TaxID=79078 RepID=A0ABU6XVM1_9FABA|nr:hypothetical protein [Stylosanthes scabra]
MKLADRGGRSNVAPEDNDPIEVSSDSESELKPEDTIINLVEIGEEHPEEEWEEDPEEEIEETLTRRSRRRESRRATPTRTDSIKYILKTTSNSLHLTVPMKATLDLLQQTSRLMIAPQ